MFVLDDDSYILDTPGFTSLSVMVEDKNRLRFYMHEFSEYEGEGRFAGCVHVNEPDCAVKNAVEEGLINRTRYDSYVEMYHELENTRKR